MRVNVDKVLERDSKISELDGRAGNYHITTSSFRWTLPTQSANMGLKRALWCVYALPSQYIYIIRSFCSFLGRLLKVNDVVS